ncbi:hypothetical protein DDW05_03040 [Candidatus Nanobsidianus stetteri]|uniref:Uncharacterized protein n=1 Tax=Nanobsidianus stetteri TaxID=1294122 RepID=A0A2T9WQU2_NANST|nr:hypothetical protein DDW05_03040 [Candidatus Nanobsidianus stetteri]
MKAPADKRLIEPIGTILALGILAISMWFTGELASLINPSYSVGYYAVSILALIAMILYIVLYFFR